MALDERTICNLALMELGHTTLLTGSGAIATDTDNTEAEDLCQLLYPVVRDAVLEKWSWPFARKYDLLVVADDGTGEVWIDLWDNFYTWPADMLVPRGFITYTSAASSYGYDIDASYGYIQRVPWPWVVGNHADVRGIFTDVQAADANFEYTKTMASTDVDLFPQEFSDAVTYLLAARLAKPLTSSDEKRQANNALYIQAVRQAMITATNAQYKRPEPDQEYVRARGLS